MTLGAPRGAITGPTPDDEAFWDPEPPQRPARRPGQPRRRRRNSYTSADAFDRRLRLAILLRDDMTCQLCGVALTLQTGQPNSAVAGHVLARWAGGLPVAENGRAECWSCSARGGGFERTRSGPPPTGRRPARPDRLANVW